MQKTVLVRYGAIPEVARFACALESPVQHGDQVVIASPRGIELGSVLETLKQANNGSASGDSESVEADSQQWEILRLATSADTTHAEKLLAKSENEFDAWQSRIREWELELELIDIEWMLDESKLVLYVLNDRGPDCTKLMLRIAAANLGTVDVQPVSAEGLMEIPRGEGGCGSGGCGSGGGCGT